MRTHHILLLLVLTYHRTMAFLVVGPRQYSVSRTALFSKKKKVQTAKANHDKKWQPHFEQLVKYQQDHGDFNVPLDSELGLWIQEQRKQYQLLMDGKKARITRKRAVALESIGAVMEEVPVRKALQNQESSIEPSEQEIQSGP